MESGRQADRARTADSEGLLKREGCVVRRPVGANEPDCARGAARPRCGVRKSVASWATSIVLATVATSCGLRAPARIDVDRMITQRGAVDARHELAARIVADPKDIAARLALAELDERAKRPSGAIEQLEAVAALSGPFGTRWHDDDRARLARLLAARGKARLARGASTAIGDLTRARDLGAAISPDDVKRGRVLAAIARLRHVDAGERAAAKQALVEIWTAGNAEPAWAGARAKASPPEVGAFGAWAWSVGAKRAGWEALRAWHDATPMPRDLGLAAAYLRARAWWVPADGPPPPDEDLVGPSRCRYAGACTAAFAIASDNSSAMDALLLASIPTRTIDPDEVAAWMELSLDRALRGRGSWGPLLAAHVDLEHVAVDRLPGWARPAFAVLAGRGSASEAGAQARRPRERLVLAAGRLLRGRPYRAVEAALRGPAELDDALLRVARARVPEPDALVDARARGVVAFVRTAAPHGPSAAVIRQIVDAYARDPAIADRLGGDAVAESVDAATAHAALGAVFEVLGDPARARAAWEAAVGVSPELDNLRGQAEAIARAGDGDAALVAATTAAAASGDPAVEWVRVARALEEVGEHVHAIEAARSALDLGSGETLEAAYEVAITASRALGRERQVAELVAARAKLLPVVPERPDDPTDAAAALAAYRRTPNAATVARMWLAARWNPWQVELRAQLLAAIEHDDPRRATIVGELLELAGNSDLDRARRAAAALVRLDPG